MNKHKDQRIGVFVDIQNLYYSAKALYHKKVDFGKILKEVTGDRKLIRAIAYVIKTDVVKKEGNFFEALEKRGYEVKSKDLQVFYGGAKKGDWDIGIAMDTIEIASKLDVIVLISGDGDYVELLQHLKRAESCKVEVAAFRKSASSRLVEEADEFMDLSEGNKFLIRVPILNRDWLVLYKKEFKIEYRLDKTHYIEYTIEDLTGELEKAGLKINNYSIQFGEIWALVNCQIKHQ